MSIEQIPPALLFDSNMFLVIGEEKVALVDTGTGFQVAETLKSIVSLIGDRSVDIVFITHRHYDHVGGLSAIIDRYHPTVYAGELDAEPLRSGDSDSTLGVKFGGSIPKMDVISVREGDVFDLGGHVMEIIETPGHTSGSICILDRVTGALFSGDTVFVDGVGRTDLPTGSMDDLRSSFVKLGNVKFDGLFSGHGPVVKAGGKAFLEKGAKQIGI